MAKCPPISKRTKALCRSFLYAGQKGNIINEQRTVNPASVMNNGNSTSIEVGDLENTEVIVGANETTASSEVPWKALLIGSKPEMPQSVDDANSISCGADRVGDNEC